jgi:putative phage-type endonuclease
MAAILGLSPYNTGHDIWLDKTGRLPEQEPSPAMVAGNHFEDGILAHAEDRLGKLTRNQYRSVKNAGIPLGANIDAIVLASGEPVEAKAVNFFGFTKELWGAEGTDEVPDRVIVQATVHMICTEMDLCHIAAFIAGRGFVAYVVKRDDEVVKVVTDAAVDFWQKFVLTDTPPDNSLPTAKTIAKMHRTPASVVPIDSDLIVKWNEAKAIESEAKKTAEAAKIEVLAALGDAEAGECDLGLLTYYEQTRKEHLVKESTFRVARFKAIKGAI